MISGKYYQQDDALLRWGRYQIFNEGQMLWVTPVIIVTQCTTSTMLAAHYGTISSTVEYGNSIYWVKTLEGTAAKAYYSIARTIVNGRMDSNLYPKGGEIWDAMPSHGGSTYVTMYELIQKSSVPSEYFDKPNLEVSF